MATSASAKRASKGSGSINKVERITADGKTSTYWEGRISYTDPISGKRKQRHVSAPTQKECKKKMNEIQQQLENGTYNAPSSLTVAEWLETWLNEYCIDIKDGTLYHYDIGIHQHIIPAIGKIKLQALTPAQVQYMINHFHFFKDEEKKLSAKSVKNYYTVLHAALEQAVKVGYINRNPAAVCTLPKIAHKEIKYLNSTDIPVFLNGIKGHRYELIFKFALFTGMRESEILGLSWDNVDFDACEITVKQQLINNRITKKYELAPTKTDKTRIISVAPSVMDILKLVKNQQEFRHRRFSLPENTLNLCFLNEEGLPISAKSLFNSYKRLMNKLNLDITFHALRHTNAVLMLQNGDDVKTVQGNLGHSTAAFTLDKYGHVSQKMKTESASRMEAFIQSVS